MKKRKGFTLVELLVVIAIIALLMGILMPALAKVRAIAYRMVCGANIAGIGKAMIAYANENNESYPVSGKMQKNRWSTFAYINKWYEVRLTDAFGGDSPTITACYYLLVRTQDCTPKQFICKGDVGAVIFTIPLAAESSVTPGTELQNIWDFGGKNNWPGKSSSYGYNMPFYHDEVQNSQQGARSFPVITSSDAARPIMSDRNPYNDKNADMYIDGKTPPEASPSWDPGESTASPPIPEHYADQYKTRNSACHQREGQNVLFNDNRVDFAKYPNVGIDNDSIWLYWGGSNVNPLPRYKELESRRPIGTPYTDGVGGPFCERDAYLVAEDNRDHSN